MGDDSKARTETTALLHEAEEREESGAVDRLVPLVYEELRALAHRHLAPEREGHTLGTTALVHEAYLKLVDATRVGRRGRAYFFGAASRAMRQILVDHARRRTAAKRGGRDDPVSLKDGLRAEGDREDIEAFALDLLDLDRALQELEAAEPRLARVVECRFFGDLSVAETAEALEVSPRTVKYDWALARARLGRAVSGGGT